MNTPNELEINPHPGLLDGDYAVKMFLGKSLEEAQNLFEENGLSRREDLSYMGPIAFKFYFVAALNYLLSDASKEDSDFASSMTALLEWRLIEEYEDYSEIKGVTKEMIQFCSHIKDNYEKFDLDESIYGDLRPRLDIILNKLES